MAVGWDYMAESKGAAEGARIANSRNANLTASLKQGAYRGEQLRRQRENEARATAAQEATIKQAEAIDRSTFYTPQGVSSSAGLNSVFDYSTQQIVDTYTSIKNDKDMDPAQQALQMRKITNQIPLIKSAKLQLDKNMADFAKLSQSGEISSSMDPMYQYVYSEMLANRFDGGIDFEGDELVFKGTMPDGEEIRLPLKDFALKLPSVDQKGGTLDDSIIGYTDDLTNQIAEYKKTGKNKPESIFETIKGERVLTKTGRAKQTAIENLIQGENKSGNELYAYGMDTLNMSRESIDTRIAELAGTMQTEEIVAPGILKSMYTDKGLEIPKNLQPREVELTTADAKVQVMEEMVDQELNVLQSVYDRASIKPPSLQPTLVDRTYASILEEGTQGMTVDPNNNMMSNTNLLGATAQDFNVAKGTGFDNIATNLQEGFNDNGEYIVTFDQSAKYEGEQPLTTTYNLSTEAGAKDFLLARFENEQGRRSSNAKDTKESKEDAMSLAPVFAKSFRDYNKAIKNQQREKQKFEEEQERIRQITMGLDPDYKSRPGYSQPEFKASLPENFQGVTI